MGQKPNETKCKYKSILLTQQRNGQEFDGKDKKFWRHLFFEKKSSTTCHKSVQLL